MANDIGGLRAKLGLDTSEVEAGLDSASAKFGAGEFSIRNYQKALLGLSFLLGSIADGDQKSFSLLKRTIVQSISTITGMTFAISSLGGAFARFAGPVGIALGALAGVASAMNEVNRLAEEGEKEKLKKYAERLQEIADAMEELTPEVQAARKDVLERNLETLTRQRIAVQALLQAYLDGSEAINLTEQEAQDLRQAGINEAKTSIKELQGVVATLNESIGKTKEELIALGNVVVAEGEESPDERRARLKKEAEEQKRVAEQESERRKRLAENEQKFQQSVAAKGRAEAIKDREDFAKMMAQIDEDLVDNQYDLEVRRILDTFELRRREIERLGGSEEDLQKAAEAAVLQVADVRKRETEDADEQAASRREQDLMRVLDIVEAVQRALFQAGDSFLSKLLAAAAIALQIAQQLQKAQAAQGGATLLDFLGIGLGGLTGLLGLFGFAGGGYTGKGNRFQPAGVVHRGEIVFEKPIVDRFGADLMSLRSGLQRSLGSYASGGLVGGSQARIAAGSPAINFSPQIVIEGTMEGQAFLIKEEPRYRRHMERKSVR